MNMYICNDLYFTLCAHNQIGGCFIYTQHTRAHSDDLEFGLHYEQMCVFVHVWLCVLVRFNVHYTEQMEQLNPSKFGSYSCACAWDLFAFRSLPSRWLWIQVRPCSNGLWPVQPWGWRSVQHSKLGHHSHSYTAISFRLTKTWYYYEV